MKKKTSLFFASLTIGFLLTALTGLIGARSSQSVVIDGMMGITDGWRGIPIPFYYHFGMGERDTFDEINQCLNGNYTKSCVIPTIGGPILIILIDLSFWTFLCYLVLKKYKNGQKNDL